MKRLMEIFGYYKFAYAFVTGMGFILLIESCFHRELAEIFGIVCLIGAAIAHFSNLKYEELNKKHQVITKLRQFSEDDILNQIRNTSIKAGCCPELPDYIKEGWEKSSVINKGCRSGEVAIVNFKLEEILFVITFIESIETHIHIHLPQYYLIGGFKKLLSLEEISKEIWKILQEQ